MQSILIKMTSIDNPEVYSAFLKKWTRIYGVGACLTADIVHLPEEMAVEGIEPRNFEGIGFPMTDAEKATIKFTFWIHGRSHGFIKNDVDRFAPFPKVFDQIPERVYCI